MNLDNVRRDDWIVAGLALLLLLDLLIAPWFSFPGVSLTNGVTTVTFSGSLTAIDTPSGWLGVLAVIAAVLVIADLAVQRFAVDAEVPAINRSRTMTRLGLAGAAALCLALKFLLHLDHFGNLGWGFWVGAVLTAGLVYFTLLAHQDSQVASTTPASASGPPPSRPRARARNDARS